uniref:Uncharacterized protein n=1 Tax=Arundo donax TaxID=35708 RepID=A0A0A9F480_ARUDO
MGQQRRVCAPCNLLPHFLRAAVGALVMLYVLRLGGGDLHALAMEPPLADVAGDPELVCIVEASAASTKGFAVLSVVVVFIFFNSRSCPRLLCMAIACSL